ncbi:MAG: adenylate kinase [Candidatus Eremiobacteraeota bacterium]|nr:adenylate kinase [Candidatus Eremiobacteraeota bacterium]MBV8434634.1 adenylate kinase [Candidatus Eremiobacteraeota bacterium]
MRLIFLGPPGAGKGTQARILERRFGARQISTGDILRENRARGTALGKEAEGYMKRGELVPDALIIAMIERELDSSRDGFIMDGFPRTVAQAEAFDALLARKQWPLDAVVLFDADRKTLVDRLSSRWTNPRNGRTYNTFSNPPRVAGVDDDDGGALVQREDDKPETVSKRLDVYDEQTKPLVAYYRTIGKLAEIDALQSVDDVAHQLAHAIGLEHAH